MSQRSKKVNTDLYLERVTIVDKKSPMFRARYPDEYHLSIVAIVGNCRVTIREWVYDNKAAQTRQYVQCRYTLGMDPK